MKKFTEINENMDGAGEQLTGKEVGGSSVNSVDFHPDGNSIVTVTGSRIARWDINTGQKLADFKGYSSECNSISFSSDGKHVVTGHQNGTVQLWDADTGKVIKIFNV